jgi:DNA-binding NarL/FixJ family response regulator
MVPLSSWDQREINHKDPEQVRRRHEFVLEAWAKGWSSTRIAKASGYKFSTIPNILDLARSEGDPRAERRKPDIIQILQRRAAVLNLWAKGWRSGAIARVTGYQANSVNRIVLYARNKGDVRATKRRG